MNETDHPALPQTSRPATNTNLLRLALMVAVAVALVVVVLKKQSARKPFQGLAVGRKAPRIFGKGWLNGPEPTAETLKDKVLVVAAWASW